MTLGFCGYKMLSNLTFMYTDVFVLISSLTIRGCIILFKQHGLISTAFYKMCEIAKWARRYNSWYVLRISLIDRTIYENKIKYNIN